MEDENTLILVSSLFGQMALKRRAFPLFVQNKIDFYREAGFHEGSHIHQPSTILLPSLCDGKTNSFGFFRRAELCSVGWHSLLGKIIHLRNGDHSISRSKEANNPEKILDLVIRFQNA
jgi:hypothetical protein